MFHPFLNLLASLVFFYVVSTGFFGDDIFFTNNVEAALVSVKSDELQGHVEKDKQEVLGRKVFLPISDYVSVPIRKEFAVDFELKADSGIVIDSKTRDILYSKNPDEVRAIASITKLMTALVVMDLNPDFEQGYVIQRIDRRDGGRINIYTGDKVKFKNLFYLSLVASDNTATMAMVSALGLSEDAFVELMNKKAKSLGLYSTNFVDTVGLNENNISTAREVIRFAGEAFDNPTIAEAVLMSGYSFETIGGRNVTVVSTDYFVKNQGSGSITIAGGKTGYIGAAGYCFVGKFLDKDNHEVISVVLGANNISERFLQTEAAINWVFENYSWTGVDKS